MKKCKEFGIIGHSDGIGHSALSAFAGIKHHVIIPLSTDEKRNHIIAKIARSTLYTFQNVESMVLGLSIEEIELIYKASEIAGFDRALYSFRALKNSNFASGNDKKLSELVGTVPVVTFKDRVNNYLKRK